RVDPPILSLTGRAPTTRVYQSRGIAAKRLQFQVSLRVSVPTTGVQKGYPCDTSTMNTGRDPIDGNRSLEQRAARAVVAGGGKLGAWHPLIPWRETACALFISP